MEYNIYANIDGPAVDPNTGRETQSSEIIHENVLIHSLEVNRPGPACSGVKNIKKSSCRAAAVCLGLLFLLLLTGLITLVCLYTKSTSEREMEMVLQHNLTKERDQLQTSSNQLVAEKKQLQEGLEALTREKDEFQEKLQYRTTLDMEVRLKTLTEERDELKMKLIDFIKANYSQPEWTYFSGSLYYISSSQKTWQESRDYCLQKGADLMIINSKEEQNFTRQLKDNLWIGLTDRETEGTWKWVDGTPLTTSFWLSGEPNSFELEEEDCGEIRYHKAENSWNDKPCDLANFWICEKKLPL